MARKKTDKPQEFVQGKRFVVVLQDAIIKTKWLDKNEYDSYGQAKEAAAAWAEREKRPAGIFDRDWADGIVLKIHAKGCKCGCSPKEQT
jgi:hypothetical protein